MSTELVHGVALALQISCQTVNHMSHDEARRSISAQIERVAHYLRGAKGLVGPDVRLAVLPEYFLTGYPLGESIPEWAAKACIAPDGAEYDALGKVADANGVYLSGNAYETDPHFPDLYFQTSFVISPAGEVVLRHTLVHARERPGLVALSDEVLLVIGGRDEAGPREDAELCVAAAR